MVGPSANVALGAQSPPPPGPPDPPSPPAPSAPPAASVDPPVTAARKGKTRAPHQPRSRFGRWFQNLRISRKLAVVIVVHLLHATVLLGVTTYGIKAVDASRAWVDGEGFWSKAQKEAVIELLNYAASGDEAHYERALAQINITLGDRQARLELERPDPDLDVARAGFIQARNHPDDVDNMIWLFQTFRHEAHIDRAIAIWTQAEDHGIEPLRALAAQLHAQRSAAPMDAAAVNQTVAGILELNLFLDDLEHDFSRTLGDGARFITTVVVWGTLGLTVLFVGSALLVSARVARHITRSLGTVKDGAQEMAAGTLGWQIAVPGRDEVAQVASAFNAMSENLAKTMREHDQQASVLAATLEATADGLLVVDADGRIVTYNEKFRAMWGIPQEVAATRSDEAALAFVIGQLADPEAFLAKVKALYSQPEAESFDILHFKDGRVFERYSKPQRIKDRHVGRVWSFRDVTQRVRAEEEQRLAIAHAEENRRLHELDEMKSDFINSAAHELRTPLTPIRAEMHMLRDRKDLLDPTTRRSVEMLDRNLARLARLVEDVLEGARVQSGHLAVTRRPMDLGAVVRDGADSFETAAREKGVTLTAQPLPCRVLGDEQRLAQVVNNLLNNALRFTPAGGTIHVAMAVQDGAVSVTVEDSGAGIPPDKQARLFRPFSQVHEQAGLRKLGTGLGLYITKGIVEEHGGTISCTSDGDGKGAAFTFTVPLLQE